MARLTDAERKELLAVSPTLAKDMASLKRPGYGFYTDNGHIDLVKIRAFLNQMNEMLGHPRKPFQPMDGDKFLL